MGQVELSFFLAPNTANKWLLMSLHCWLSLKKVLGEKLTDDFQLA